LNLSATLVDAKAPWTTGAILLKLAAGCEQCLRSAKSHCGKCRVFDTREIGP